MIWNQWQRAKKTQFLRILSPTQTVLSVRLFLLQSLAKKCADFFGDLFSGTKEAADRFVTPF